MAMKQEELVPLGNNLSLLRHITSVALGRRFDRKELANLVGVHEMTLKRWENGYSEAGTKNLDKLLSVFEKVLGLKKYALNATMLSNENLGIYLAELINDGIGSREIAGIESGTKWASMSPNQRLEALAKSGNGKGKAL